MQEVSEIAIDEVGSESVAAPLADEILNTEELVSFNTQRLIQQYQLVLQLSNKRRNFTNNARRPQILTGMAKITALVARFKNA
jgi:uncharacterized protein YgbK (DUF1537 family)